MIRFYASSDLISETLGATPGANPEKSAWRPLLIPSPFWLLLFPFTWTCVLGYYPTVSFMLRTRLQWYTDVWPCTTLWQGFLWYSLLGDAGHTVPYNNICSAIIKRFITTLAESWSFSGRKWFSLYLTLLWWSQRACLLLYKLSGMTFSCCKSVSTANEDLQQWTAQKEV